MNKRVYVYILSGQTRVLYVGVTNDIHRRLWQHRNAKGSTFARRYRIDRLVHVEIFSDAYTAICREKEIKKWRRAKKIALVQSSNPAWKDLSLDW